MTTSIYENSQQFSVLKASEYAFSLQTESPQKVVNVGNEISLVVALQGLNNGRALFSGSVDMFSNELFAKWALFCSRSSQTNSAFSRNLINWTF